MLDWVLNPSLTSKKNNVPVSYFGKILVEETETKLQLRKGFNKKASSKLYTNSSYLVS